MRLVRASNLFPSSAARKNTHLGPEAGGCFFSLEGFGDLPSGSVDYIVELSALLSLGCRVWLGNAENPSGWERIEDPSQLEGRWKWHQKEVPASDGWGYEILWSLHPWMPEFYVKPFNWTIRKKLRIANAILRQKEGR